MFLNIFGIIYTTLVLTSLRQNDKEICQDSCNYFPKVIQDWVRHVGNVILNIFGIVCTTLVITLDKMIRKYANIGAIYDQKVL